MLTRTYAARGQLCAASLLLLVGCGKLAGIDDYEVGSATSQRTDCGGAEVPNADGDCVVRIGPRSCIEGSPPDDNANCPALLPPGPCELDNCGDRKPCNSAQMKVGNVSCPTMSYWVTCAREGEFPGAPDVDPTKLRYVRRDFSGPSDGSFGKPWTTIKAALAEVPPGGAVLVAAGVYAEEGLVLDKANVHLRGACPDQVLVRGTSTVVAPGEDYPCDPSFKAALCVTGSGSRIYGINFTGTVAGIAVIGATDVNLDAVPVTQTERQGIRVAELAKPDGRVLPAQVTLRAVLVRNASGAGIQVSGAHLDNAGLVNVFDTRRLNGHLGYGISVIPGPTLTSARVRTASRVELSGVVVTGSPEAALHVAGSTITVTDSFLGNLESVDPEGRGLLVERDLLIGERRGQVTLRRTIVQHTRDAAIDVRSSELTLEDVTIRDTLGRAGDACSGQGIRLRADRVAPASATVIHSLIEGSGQAGIHAHGASVTFDHSIIRGSAPGAAAPACAPHLGDGVTLHSLPPPRDQASLHLDHARIDGNVRAAVANFDGTITAAASVLSCNRHGLVSTSAVSDVWCGCGGSLVPCMPEALDLEPWVSPGAASGHENATEDWIVPVRNFGTENILGNGVVFLLDAPEVAPAFPDSDGCAVLTGVPSDLDRRRLAIWAESYVGAVWQVPRGVVPACSAGFRTGSADQNAALLGRGPAVIGNTALMAAVGPTDGSFLAQSPESGTKPWLPVGVAPVVLLRYNVDPGWHDFVRNDGVVCDGPAGSSESGDPIAGVPNGRRVLLEPELINNVSWTTCHKPNPCGTGFPDPARKGECLTGAAARTACTETSLSMTAATPFHNPARSECLCTNCMDLFAACITDTACRDVAACAARTGCHLDTCAGPCGAEIARLGADSTTIVALGNCRLAADQACGFGAP